MTKEQLQKYLEDPSCNDDERLELINDFASGAGLPDEISRCVLLKVDDLGDSFCFSQMIRLRVLELLRRDSVSSLETVLEHLAFIPFVDEPETVKEVYLREVNDAIGPLVRPFNCAGPDELALYFTRAHLGREPGLDEKLDVDLLHKVLRLCDLVMGGGFFPILRHPATLSDVIDVLERNL